jgi:putative transposase
MPRRNIQFVQGEYYHIYNRGAGRQSIFLNDADYTRCLRTLKEVALECNITVIAYSLLPNHYHWLVRQDGETPAGDLPKRVFGSYSQVFNLLYKRSGTLFQDRFQVRQVTTDNYLCHLCRYIHANPVKDGFAVAPELWSYSNYQEWIGMRHGTLVDHAFVQRFFPESDHYKCFVFDFIRGQANLLPAIKAYFDTLWDG